jgi:F-box and leucine-rich repeat protein 2/20
LLELFDDVSRGIIVEWLEPADVVRLDSAYSNRALSRVLRDLLCSPLTLLDVSYSTSQEKLKWAMKRRLNLGSIRLSSFASFPEDVMTSIALTSCLDRLKVLDIKDSDMNDALLLPILNKCHNSLKELRFRGCHRITDESAAPIGECSELEVLHPNDAVTSRLSEIVEGLPKLRECDFSSSSSLTDEGVIGLAMTCPGLEIVDLSNCQSITDAAIASLVQCRALKKLDLNCNYQLTDATFAGLSEGCWPKMETLDLSNLRQLSDASFVSLARACPSLVEVRLKLTNVTDEAVWTLCQLCPSILKLYIFGCSNVTDRSLVVISEHLPSVAILWCGGNEAITDDGIEKLVAKCHSIKTLWIYGCPSISDRSVRQIADHCTAMKELDLADNDRITAVSLGALGAQCLKLEKVDISHLRLVSQEDKENLRLHFPRIDWNADHDEDNDEEEEDEDEEEEEDEEE